jgi:hypothetical protein
LYEVKGVMRRSLLGVLRLLQRLRREKGQRLRRKRMVGRLEPLG